MTLRVRELNDHERVDVQRIARSHTLGAALVRRAQIVVHAMDGLKAEAIATRMDLCGNTVRHWLNRFNARGLEGLKEDVRTGRPPTYSAEQRSAVITAALTRPSELGLPFASWTLDRLVSYLSGQGIAMRRSRISESSSARACAGARTKPGSVRGLIPTSRKKGGDRTALYAAADRQRSHLPGRDGTAEGQEPSGPAARPAGGSQSRTGPAGDRLRPPRCRRLCFRRLPASGKAFTQPYERRTTTNWVDFLSAVEAWIDPASERVYAILDNLNTHSAPDVLLFSLLHPRWEFVFQPKYAAYLNLIEPWWKIMRSLALKGRRFETWAEIAQAVERATAYWNEHKHPFIWGRRRRHRTPRRFGLAAIPAISRT